MNIGNPRREIVIEPLTEPQWIEEPAPTKPQSVPEPQREREPVPA